MPARDVCRGAGPFVPPDGGVRRVVSVAPPARRLQPARHPPWAAFDATKDVYVIGHPESRGRPPAEEQDKTPIGELEPQQWDMYRLTGAFYEESRRSRCIYLIRRSRPTIVHMPVSEPSPMIVPKVALCLHPLAYYSATWTGAMAPSDEAIAHVLLIRGDERLFWRKANQIPLDRPNSGV